MPASDLISRAARFFVLAEEAYSLQWPSEEIFWEMSSTSVVETASCLPAIAVASEAIGGSDFWEPDNPPWRDRILATYPLPGVLPPQAVRWHDHLVAVWRAKCTLSDWPKRNLAWLALVRLDGCGMPDGHERPSRLPEWLAEVQKIASGERRVVDSERRMAWADSELTRTDELKWDPFSRKSPKWDRYWELEALAALSAWHPAPRVITPPETLRAWVDFWLKMYQSDDPMEKGIATIALLNLPEADLRAASIAPIPTVGLLQQLITAIQAAAGREDRNYLSLLDWQPARETVWPVAKVRKVAQSWLKLARHQNPARRRDAWQQIIRWDRAGSLAICGMDLLPELVQAVPTEKDGDVLWAMAQWAPGAERFTATGTPGSLSQLQQLEEAWKQHRVSWNRRGQMSAWLAGIRLHQTGLASEPPRDFMNAYLFKVAMEGDHNTLLILAHWSPGADVPGMWRQDWRNTWQQRLLDKDKSIREVAGWALMRQCLEEEDGRSLRGTALELWRAGKEASSKAMHTPGTRFARFQEVRVRLAAGEVLNFLKFWEKLFLPDKRCRPPLALPPGSIAGNEWSMVSGES